MSTALMGPARSFPGMQIPQCKSPASYDTSNSSPTDGIQNSSPIKTHTQEPSPKPVSPSTLKVYVSHLGYSPEVLSHLPPSFLAQAQAQRAKVRAARKARDKAQADINKLQDTSSKYNDAYTYFHNLEASDNEDDPVVLKTRAFKARGEAERTLVQEKNIWKQEFASYFESVQQEVLDQQTRDEERRGEVLGQIAVLSPRGEIPWEKEVTDLFSLAKLERILSAREKLTDLESRSEANRKAGLPDLELVKQLLDEAREAFCNEAKELWGEKVRVENERVVRGNEKVRSQRPVGGHSHESVQKGKARGKFGRWFFRR